MEIIERVIFNNLVRQQSVMLPGVGTLIVYKEAGRFDTQSRRVIAPRLRVEFVDETPDSYLTIIDLMMQEGAQRKDDVKTLYEHWVAENCKKNDGGIRIGEVGFASKSADGSYAFTPSKELQDLLNPLENYSIEVKPIEKSEETTENQPLNTKKKHNRKWQNILIVVFAIMTLVVWYCFDKEIFSQPNQTEQHQHEQVVKEKSKQNNEIKPQETVEQKIDTIIKAEPKKEEIKNNGRFCIIAGMYSIESNADKLIETLGENKKYAEKLPARNNRIYVSVRRFETRQDAEVFLNKNRKEHPDYWILETRNKQ